MNARIALLASGFLLALATTTLAATPSVHERMTKMERRIDAGIKSGELTRKEADSLHKELANIKKREHRMKVDGVVNAKETSKLHDHLDKLDKHIVKYTTNNRKN